MMTMSLSSSLIASGALIDLARIDGMIAGATNVMTASPSAVEVAAEGTSACSTRVDSTLIG